MKNKILLLITLLITATAFSQESLINDIDNPLLNKYISLAMQNYPLKRASDATVDKAKAEVSIASLGILDIFNAGYFYSPQKNSGIVLVPGTNGTNSIVTKGFQFGVNISLGSILSKPATVKAAKAEYAIVKAQNDDYNITLASTVKSRYYDYVSAKKQLELRTLAAKDLRTILTNAQTQFQNGTTTIEVYSTTKNASVEADASVLEAEVNYLKTKNALEDMIGKKLEDVK